MVGHGSEAWAPTFRRKEEKRRRHNPTMAWVQFDDDFGVIVLFVVVDEFLFDLFEESIL
jgi:hypothetical protein